MALAASRLAASAGALTGYQSSGLSPLEEQAACARTISQSVRSVMTKPLVITVDRSHAASLATPWVGGHRSAD
jgi:hypothetical protein